MKPIIFSKLMIQAILAEQKMQTRRLMKPQPLLMYGKHRYDGVQEGIHALELLDDSGNPTEKYSLINKPPYKPGDVLYVKETWNYCTEAEQAFHSTSDLINGYCYKASFIFEQVVDVEWRSPIYMPRDAARIFLKVTDVSVERLQDISVEDCIKEGACMQGQIENMGIYHSTHYGCKWEDVSDEEKAKAPRHFFKEIWDGTYAKRDGGIYKWENNPYVFVYEFMKVEV